MSVEKQQKRLKICLKNPNPLITQWLTQWLQEAEPGSKMAQTLETALDSIKRYPLPIYQAQECAILNGFTKTLCEHIERKMLKCQQNDMTNYQQEVQQIVQKVEKTKKIVQLTESSSFTLPSGKFEIKLLVDTAETTGKNKQILDDTRAFLQDKNVPYEVRHLSVGDFLWIARDAANNELVLPYIVERKRYDDMSKSIRDGRYHEQKHRLKQCGLPHVIYLLEYSNPNHCGLPITTLQQAMVNTQIHAHFHLVYTKNHKDTINYLSQLTKVLIKQFESKTLKSSLQKQQTQQISGKMMEGEICYLMDFKHFYKDSARNAGLTVRELFVQQLMQLHGVSLDKAVAIVSKYETPRLLVDAYTACDTKEQAQQLLADIPCGAAKRPLGKKLSEIFYNFYMRIFGDEENELAI